MPSQHICCGLQVNAAGREFFTRMAWCSVSVQVRRPFGVFFENLLGYPLLDISTAPQACSVFVADKWRQTLHRRVQALLAFNLALTSSS